MEPSDPEPYGHMFTLRLVLHLLVNFANHFQKTVLVEAAQSRSPASIRAGLPTICYAGALTRIAAASIRCNPSSPGTM
jgi:hypothetical protein